MLKSEAPKTRLCQFRFQSTKQDWLLCRLAHISSIADSCRWSSLVKPGEESPEATFEDSADMAGLHVSMMPICGAEAKIYASLLSLAIGDALGEFCRCFRSLVLPGHIGAPAEFSSRREARAMQITEMQPNQTFG